MQAGTEKQIEDLDKELLAAGVPLRYRPLDCFKKLYGSVPDGPRRNELFDPLIDWYLKKYGDVVRWDGIVARFPILIRGVVYLGQARFVGEGEVLANFQEGIEQLPDEVAHSLSPEERRPILEKLTFGARGFFSLHNLIIDDGWLGDTECALVRRALYDLENAAVTLKHTGDTQAASVQAHEAAEKFLKAALSKAGSTKALKSFGHDIPAFPRTVAGGTAILVRVVAGREFTKARAKHGAALCKRSPFHRDGNRGFSRIPLRLRNHRSNVVVRSSEGRREI
jgi:hypothetical protein